MKIFQTVLLLASALTLSAFEWRMDGNRLEFILEDGMKFEFVPSPYSGIRFGGTDFFCHLPSWSARKREDNHLRLHNRISYAKTVQKNEFSETVEVMVPMIRLDEAKGKVTASPNFAKFRFRLRKGIPALSVSCSVENHEKETLTVAPFWMGRHLKDFSTVTGMRHSPPPEHLVTEKMEKKTLPGGNAALFLKKDGKNAIGIIGKTGRYYTGDLLQIIFPKSTIPSGKASEFSLAFVLPGKVKDPEDGYKELLKIQQAFHVLDGIAFVGKGEAKEKEKSAPEYGLFHKFGTRKTKDGMTERIPDGFAQKQTYADFRQDGKQLYVRFHCEEPDPAKMKLKFGAVGDPVWEDDCVELCLASNWSNRGFSHFMANVQGARNLLSHNVSLNREKQEWNIFPELSEKSWEVLFSIALSSLDYEWISKEKYLPVHLNRESHSSMEYSGWPTEKFKDPVSFGRLIFCSYPEYLKNQLAICRSLAQTVRMALPAERFEFPEGDYFSNALADLKLRELRRKIDFEIGLKQGTLLLQRSRNDVVAGKELSVLLKRLENSLEDASMRQAFNRLRGEVLKQAGNGCDFRVWNKSPWLYLAEDDYPPSGQESSGPLSLYAGIGEYESAAFAVTNFTDTEQKICIKVMENLSGIPVVLRYGYPAKSSIGEVNDALPLLQETLNVPPRKSRELHLTFYTGGVKSGEHSITIAFMGKDGEPVSKRILLNVYPVALQIPERTFNVFFQPRSMLSQVGGPEMFQAFLKDRNTHFAHVQQVNGGSIPTPVFSEDGKNQTDYETFNRCFEGCRKEDISMVYWGFHVGSKIRQSLEKGFRAPFMSPEFRKRFTVWLQDWYRSLEKIGLTENLYMYMFDETTHADALALMKLAKESVPRMRIFITLTTSSNMRDIHGILPYVDAVSPHFYTWRGKSEFWKLFRDHGILISPYFNIAPASSKDEPYSVYRRMGWLAKSVGSVGCGTWVYCYPNQITWSPVAMSMVQIKTAYPSFKQSLQGAPEQLLPGEYVIPTKRWEGYREGMEEFYYLDMLEKQIRKNPSSPLGRKALALINEALKEVCGNQDVSSEITTKYKKKFLEMLICFDSDTLPGTGSHK